MNDVCAICLESDSESKLNFTLPCNHSFHLNCIKQWLDHKGNCPLCREYIKTKFKVNLFWYLKKTFFAKIFHDQIAIANRKRIIIHIKFSNIKYIYLKKNKIKFSIIDENQKLSYKSLYIEPRNQTELFFNTLRCQLESLAYNRSI
jgi:hypothetical protein